MNEGLRDVLTAMPSARGLRTVGGMAADGGGAAGGTPEAQEPTGAARRAAGTTPIALIEGPKAETRPTGILQGAGGVAGSPPMEPGTLRMAFWVCSLCEAFRERRDSGQLLTERETSLLEMTAREFAAMRPAAIEMVVRRLDAVLAAAVGGQAASATETMEGFAHATLRGLSGRAVALLESEGPDAAFSLLGGDRCVIEPLAIFQTAFGAAVALAEGFGALAGSGGGSLRRAAEALEAEIERI